MVTWKLDAQRGVKTIVLVQERVGVPDLWPAYGLYGPVVEWGEIDDDLISILKTDCSEAVNENSKERFLAEFKRMENAKNNPLTDMSEAILDTQDHRCLLLTDSKEFKT